MAISKSRQTRSIGGQRCEPSRVVAFDYSALSHEFSKLAKPAQRALVNNHVYTPHDLSRWRLEDLLKLHGIGPSAVPKLKDVLKRNRLRLKA